MIWVGLVLLVLGFALAVPRGGSPGSVAHRNVAMGAYIYQTPGHTADPESPSRPWRINVIGGIMAIAGICILMFAS